MQFAATARATAVRFNSAALLRTFAPRPAPLSSSRPTVAAMSMKLFVGNLSWDTRKEDLEELFTKYGQVTDAFVANDRETGRSRGFGFVTLEDGGQNAMSELDGSEFMGRNIKVNEATGERGGGGRGGGRGGYGGRGGGRGGYGGGGGGGYRSGGYGGGGGGGGYRSGGGGGRGGYGGGDRRGGGGGDY